MEAQSSAAHSQKLQNLFATLTKCKTEYLQDKEELKKLQEENTKLQLELKEMRELEKSHRYHLLTSREMIGNLQETVSQLVYLKRDTKKLKEELLAKDSLIEGIEREKEMIIKKHNDSVAELKNSNAKQVESITAANERKIQQVQRDTDTQIAQFTCVIDELRAKIKELEGGHRDKMNVIVLEYEEKLQRSAAQITQLHDQHAGLVARTDANIDAYRRRLEELEEKLKQSQFKHYLAQSTLPSQSQYESEVERPYSVTGHLESEHPSPEISKPRTQKNVRQMNTLQVNYFDKGPPKNDKKGQFNIVKKRKLYNSKEFQDF